MDEAKIKALTKNIKPVDFSKVDGKTVLLRVDLNSSVKDGKLLKGPKIVAHFRTVKKFLDNGAKVVIITHQGRKGRDDFIDLKQHCNAMQEMLGEPIAFCSWNQDYISEIKKLKKGQALMLDNTRFLEFETKEVSAEEHSKNPVIKGLASVSDMYVLDALSIAHRPHATVVGFVPLLKSFAGPVLYSELKTLEKISSIKGKTVLVLGGMKPDDSLFIAESMLTSNSAEKVLAGGVIGELALLAKGKKLGAKEVFLKEKGLLEFVPKMKELIDKFSEKIICPLDLAIEKNTLREEITLAKLPVKEPILDIGEMTANTYASEIRKASVTILNGPLGKFECDGFSFGTRKILDAMAESKGFALIGGGDTVTAMIKLGFKESEFGHVSLAGKALLEFLAGEKLAGLETLANAGK